MRWLRKIIRVCMVVALGAFASLPFRLLPPPHGDGTGNSADRIVLQNDATKIVQQTPLQIAPPTTMAEVGAGAGSQTLNAEVPRTASHRPGQATRKDLPTWNSKLESNSPPPPLPDMFEPNGTTPNGYANPVPPPIEQNRYEKNPGDQSPMDVPGATPSLGAGSAASPGF